MIIVIIGGGVFWSGDKAGVMRNTIESTEISNIGEKMKADNLSPKSNWLAYSFDTFIPLIDLHMKKLWMPDANSSGTLKILKKIEIPISGGVIRGYMWFHTTIGWILTTLFIIGLSGFIRK